MVVLVEGAIVILDNESLTVGSDIGTASRHSARQDGLSIAAHVFHALPLPFFLIGDDGRIVECNASAEKFLGVDQAEVRSGLVLSVLALARIEEERLISWNTWNDLRAEIDGGERIPCRVMSRDGRTVTASLVGSSFAAHGELYTLLGIVHDRTVDVRDTAPPWALLDPVTDLPNRVFWEQHQSSWNEEDGMLLVLDVDDLKTVNDLYGHAEGDRLLAMIGRTLRQKAPAGGAIVRYGGDEFVGRFGLNAASEVVRFAQTMNQELSEAARAQKVSVVPHVSYGYAEYRGGGLTAAMAKADDNMYAQKGTLLRSQRGGRLIISRTRQTDLRNPGIENEAAPGHLSSQFGVEFDAALRRLYRHSAEEARAFVAFAQPDPGTAVIEVGAGAGRMAFDGGLADAVGRDGVLLLTDPSEIQLQQARKRAVDTQHDWLRFLVAPAERLPVASRGADLVLGAWFIHLCDAAQVLRELTRVVRLDGRMALDVIANIKLAPAWMDILWPVRQALTDAGMPFSPPGHVSGEVAQMCEDEGLSVERSVYHHAALEFQDWRLAWQFLSQGGHLRLMCRGIPTIRIPAVLDAVKARMEEIFGSASADDLVMPAGTDYVVARRI